MISDRKLVGTRRFSRILAGGWLVASLVCGCQKEGEIVSYSVPRNASGNSTHPVPERASQQQSVNPERRGERMLAAIVARNGTTWFFKLIGSGKSVAEQTAPFRSLIESIRFTEQAPGPEWKLPQGWRQQPGSGMRYATIQIDTPAQPLELAVTPLKTGEGDFDSYVLANVDRWRQQLGLSPTTEADLFGSGGRDGQLVTVKCGDGGKAFVVDLVGEPASSLDNQLASSSPIPPAGHGSTDIGNTTSGNRPSLTYQAPSGWTPGKVDGMRQVAFQVRDGSRQAEMTVVSLAASGGDLSPTSIAGVNKCTLAQLDPTGSKAS